MNAELALASRPTLSPRCCDNPRCRREFVPRLPWQRYCRAVCRQQVARAAERQARKLFLEWAAAQAQPVAAAEQAAETSAAIPPGRWPETHPEGQRGLRSGRMRSTAPLQNQRIDGFGAKREAQERFGRVDGRADVRPNGLAVLKDRRG